MIWQSVRVWWLDSLRDLMTSNVGLTSKYCMVDIRVREFNDIDICRGRLTSLIIWATWKPISLMTQKSGRFDDLRVWKVWWLESLQELTWKSESLRLRSLEGSTTWESGRFDDLRVCRSWLGGLRFWDLEVYSILWLKSLGSIAWEFMSVN